MSDETPLEHCPWCNQDTCEWFIGLPCRASGHEDHFHKPIDKDDDPDYDDDEPIYDDDCAHCECYWDDEGVCCDCGAHY